MFLSYKNKVTGGNFVNTLTSLGPTVKVESNLQLLFVLPTNGSNEHFLPQLQPHLHNHITTLPSFFTSSAQLHLHINPTLFGLMLGLVSTLRTEEGGTNIGCGFSFRDNEGGRKPIHHQWHRCNWVRIE